MRLLLAIAFLISNAIVFGQSTILDVEFEIGPINEVSKKTVLRFPLFFSDDERAYVSVFSYRHDDVRGVQLFDKTLKLKFQSFPSLEGGDDVELGSCILRGGKLYGHASQIDELAGLRRFYYAELDRKSLSLIGEPTEYFKTEIKPIRGNYGGRSYMNLSNDHSAFMIYEEVTHKVGEPVTFNVFTFDENYKPLFEGGFTTASHQNTIKDFEFSVTNSGNLIYIATVLDVPEGAILASNPNYKKVVRLFNARTKKTSYFELALPRNSIQGFKAVEVGNLVHCIGFYSEGMESEPKGIFTIAIDLNTDQISSTKMSPFDFGVMTKEEEKLSYPNNYSGYSIDKMTMTDDGGILITNTYSSSIISTSEYISKNPFIIKLNAEGEIEWSRMVYMEQRSDISKKDFIGSYICVRGDETFLLFNDNPKNTMNSAENKRVEGLKLKSANLVIGKIDKAGNFERRTLYNTKDKGVLPFIPKNAEYSGGNVIYFVLLDNDEERMVRVTLD